jgi:hypothetical protein
MVVAPVAGALAADRQVLADLVHAEQRREDQAIKVGFGDHAAAQAASWGRWQPTTDAGPG